ncbi:related to Mig1 protein [Ustilago bromivora]|uniref:Related to Mig1 protein n=1 Tax=Ustilago bromivora TaxID=307758 RepID=A0A1K0H9F3_9BASI|nr:related to Mig1 protein [Ustilago bromivora]SYW83666.1 related to Mig1 protein, induced during biotrophic phase [Ustilago bromivora]
MTHASTSAANFGLLLVALVLMLHSVVGELAPRHVRHHLFARQDANTQCQANFASNYHDYKTRCENGSNAQHTCFTHWAGDLTTAIVCTLIDPLDIRKSLMIKDDTMKDFTMKESTDTFTIRYPKLGGVQLLYYNYNPKTGCKDIKLIRGDDKAWRIWVSDEDGNGRDIDTKNHAETTKTLCSKWIHIHVKRDG